MVMTRSMRLKRETQVPDLIISSLPEALLTHILSFLETTESVSTSVLSTRWRNLFAYVPVLDFHMPFFYPNPEEFVKFVHQVSSLHDVFCTMTKFRIDMGLHPCDVSDVSSWVTAAIRRSAQNINIEVRQISFTCTLPQTFFTSHVLVDIRLYGGFVIDVTGPVSLPCLKTIDLTNCKFSNANSAKRLFSSCPKLEDLLLRSCYSCDGSVISISILSLKNLSMSGLSGCEWELNNVSNIETLHLYIYDSNTTKCCSVNILKSLRKASIRVYSGVDNGMLRDLVNKFEEVQILSLWEDSMEALSTDSSLLPMFNKLTTLALKVGFSRGWKFSPVLLERSPCLELLQIQGDGFSNWDQEFPEINILLPKHIPICFSRSLKEVVLYRFLGKDVEYEWLGYLLKNAELLERLTATVSLVDENEEVEIKKKLLALPRGSKNCQIGKKEVFSFLAVFSKAVGKIK